MEMSKDDDQRIALFQSKLVLSLERGKEEGNAGIGDEMILRRFRGQRVRTAQRRRGIFLT